MQQLNRKRKPGKLDNESVLRQDTSDRSKLDTRMCLRGNSLQFSLKIMYPGYFRLISLCAGVYKLQLYIEVRLISSLSIAK